MHLRGVAVPSPSLPWLEIGSYRKQNPALIKLGLWVVPDGWTMEDGEGKVHTRFDPIPRF